MGVWSAAGISGAAVIFACGVSMIIPEGVRTRIIKVSGALAARKLGTVSGLLSHIPVTTPRITTGSPICISASRLVRQVPRLPTDPLVSRREVRDDARPRRRRCLLCPGWTSLTAPQDRRRRRAVGNIIGNRHGGANGCPLSVANEGLRGGSRDRQLDNRRLHRTD